VSKGRIAMNAVRTMRSGVAALLICLAITGCRPAASIEQTLVPPPVRLAVTYDAGTPLTQPPRSESALNLPDASALMPMHLALVVVTDDLATVGEPLSVKARLITASGGSNAVLSSAQLTRPLRLLTGTQGQSLWEQAQLNQLALTEQLLLTPQTTVRVELVPLNAPEPSAQLTLALAPITREPATQAAPVSEEADLRLAVTTTGQVEVRRRRSRASSGSANNASPSQAESAGHNGDDDASTSPSGANLETRAETVVIDLAALQEQAEPIILCWPLPASDARAGQWAMIRLQAVTAAPTRDDLSHLNQALQASHELLMSRPAALPTRFLSRRADIVATLELLPLKKQRRSAMVALSGTTGASLAGDLALVADDVLLELLATRIVEQAAKETSDDLASLGWLMDRTSFEVVTQQTSSRVTDTLAGVLLSHLGEPARRPSLMRELLESMRTRLEFETRLQAENLIALEDDAPSSRVRAYQWLVARNLAPVGYDPLGSAQARQEALDQAAAATAGAGATP
jgi:hypothetical protein